MAGIGIDILAAGIGNIHGPYPPTWKSLKFEVIGSIREAAGIPLVLHGGSGIPKEQVQKAISLGVSKINVNTELQQVFTVATRKYFDAKSDLKPKGYDPRKVLKPGCEAIRAMVIKLCNEFGSTNRA
jgi:fructose-bisphosphate aldolase class II